MKPFNPDNFLILVVDDIYKNIQLLVEVLDRTGYATTFATSGQQAIKRINNTQPDLILLDLMMPQMNGIEVCEILQADPQTASIPLIFLTASSEKDYLLQAFERGAVDYVTKPFKIPELLARIKTHLELKQMQDELQQTHSKLEKLVLTDPLTGVASRRALFAFAEQEFERVKRYPSLLSLLIVDIDRFKSINDTYGHDIGDDVLIVTANAIDRCLRKVDRVGRFGGEEFVVILPETDLEGALMVAERIRVAIASQSFEVENQSFAVTASIGVSTYQSEDRTLDEVLNRADRALYQAKGEGRDRVIFSEELGARETRRQGEENEQ